MSATPSVREVKLYKIKRILSEIETINLVKTDSDKLSIITDILKELNKQLFTALVGYLNEIEPK